MVCAPARRVSTDSSFALLPSVVPLRAVAMRKRPPAFRVNGARGSQSHAINATSRLEPSALPASPLLADLRVVEATPTGVSLPATRPLALPANLLLCASWFAPYCQLACHFCPQSPPSTPVTIGPWRS